MASRQPVTTLSPVARPRASASRPTSARIARAGGGTESLANEIVAVGLRPVRRWKTSRSPSSKATRPPPAGRSRRGRTGHQGRRAVGRDQCRPHLALGTGVAAGNGAMVAALQAATDAEPQVAGKPAPA
ncbi:putative hydrolase [Mycobacterium xenopi 3993]|nr:putative hydrolase [Mycobacterium xenopi 3993]